MNFKPVSKAPKVIKIGSKATENHYELVIKSLESPHLRKNVSAHVLIPNAYFSHEQIQTKKPLKNSPETKCCKNCRNGVTGSTLNG